MIATTAVSQPERITISLVKSLAALLGAVGRGAPVGAEIVCRRRAWADRYGTTLHVNPRDRYLAIGSLPTAVVRILSDDAGYAWRVHLAARRSDGRPIGLGVLAARFAFEREYVNPTEPGSPHGKQWVWPQPAIDLAITRASAWLAPTMVLDGRSEIVVMWALEEPIDLEPVTAAAETLALLGRLAKVVGAQPVPADVAISSLTLPLPGFATDQSPQVTEFTTAVHCDLSRLYTRDEIEAAITAPAAIERRRRVRESA